MVLLNIACEGPKLLLSVVPSRVNLQRKLRLYGRPKLKAWRSDVRQTVPPISSMMDVWVSILGLLFLVHLIVARGLD
ncbi:uncharacterized protein P174DRAFT_46424 [Aspergillus novofumigatus IBT 16806]|uniref:Uncharacterized protein n=1 Tax=Aspergillus novofumigatus (strain IBT 16806) TaxID=1392255 RepID=A0A2I1CNX9_ASPN1|nr:uncharacterized protein P174DRAFT_46424 [Aspergillus novofumigatus IBT 16806]PKX99347.1 hypothetical protein P174DRAFT_46424 [Aspergillus novofumigatus IBT 16806]